VLKRYLKLRVPMLHGDDVKAVQRKVGVRVDGWYGTDTRGQVRIFQRRHGLDADGIVGPNTARSLGLTWKGPSR
jgi:peptidoglycan hydrolase-like protein with peptidoglycan-binding domain